MKRIYLIVIFVFSTFLLCAQSKPLYAFDFKMEHIPLPERTALLVEEGYSGVTFAMKNDDQIKKYNDYLSTVEAKAGAFSVPVVYFPYHFHQSAEVQQRQWEKVLDVPSLKNVWVIFVDRDSTATQKEIKEKLRYMAQSAMSEGKNLIIYPHDKTLIESTEEALPYIQELGMSNLYVTMHSCHEIRAGNGSRMLEVAIKAAPYLKFASVAGSDVTMHSTGSANWADAIQPLDAGDYDIAQFVYALDKIRYDGEVFLHTFGLEEEPREHLSRSMKKWNEINRTLPSSSKNISDILDAPENAYFDQGSQSWFISSLGGGKVTIEKDGYGWITRLNNNLEVVASRWVDGLDAPTGMTSHEGYLYVTDRGVLVKISIATGEILEKIELPGARFPNDAVVAANGDIYVSETYDNTIYKIGSSGKAEVWLKLRALECPNGLCVDGNQLIVATWGPMTNEATFETSRKGTLKSINLKTKEINNIGKGPIANFDGVIKFKKHYYATDWVGGRLLKITKSGAVTEVLTGFNQFADLGIDLERGIIVVPEMSKNRFIKLNLEGL
ncbi:TIM barrel protein [Marinoscillum furvescens]|uniref:Sugar phosphate isomerase/epimerase n=1 Tax=Marinoscillum furvescens DSM 4134 TaxID=1122208 RepID=A0A3D9L1U1_MARFU|nr:TIM barrel protein [Marinoscillum furvescens]RED98333.1 sugar phosphate isomerase/epimerase [Marinoscillum furvescens DSM 4134]